MPKNTNASELETLINAIADDDKFCIGYKVSKWDGNYGVDAPTEFTFNVKTKPAWDWKLELLGKLSQRNLINTDRGQGGAQHLEIMIDDAIGAFKCIREEVSRGLKLSNRSQNLGYQALEKLMAFQQHGMAAFGPISVPDAGHRANGIRSLYGCINTHKNISDKDREFVNENIRMIERLLFNGGKVDDTKSDAGHEADTYFLFQIPETDIKFIIKKNRWEKLSDEEVLSHYKFVYESNSCPTNWIKDIVAVIKGNDTDPHGFAKLISWAKIPDNFDEDDENWTQIFPDVFKNDAGHEAREISDGIMYQKQAYRADQLERDKLMECIADLLRLDGDMHPDIYKLRKNEILEEHADIIRKSNEVRDETNN